PRLGLDLPAVPDVCAPEHVDASDRACFGGRQPLRDRLVDQHVVCRRRVVVAVPDVLTTDDACQLRNICAVQCLLGTVGVRPWCAYRADTGPAQGWCRHGRNDCSLRLRGDSEGPPARGRRPREPANEVFHVESLRLWLVTDLEDDAAGLDPATVHVAAEELTSVQAACERSRDVGTGELLLPERRLFPA